MHQRSTPAYRFGTIASLLSVLAAPALPPELAQAQGDAPATDEFPAELKVVEPWPNRDKVGPMKPTWCAGVKPTTEPAHRVAGRISRTLRSGVDPSKLPMLFKDFCAYADHPGFQKQLAYLVQFWINTRALSRADALKSLTLRADRENFLAAHERSCEQLGKPGPEASADERAAIEGRRAFFGCGPAVDVEWHFDREPEPARQIDRLYFAERCLNRTHMRMRPDAYVWIGICGHDVEALDRKKMEQETVAMSAPFKLIALESYAASKAKMASAEGLVKDKVASDPDYKKVLYDVPKQAWSDWVKGYSTSKADYEAAWGVERALFAPRKSLVQASLEGCENDLRPRLAKHIKRAKAKTMDGFYAAVSTGPNPVLLDALAKCTAIDGSPFVANQLRRLRMRLQDARGPRMAVRNAMRQAIQEIRADRPKFPIGTSELGRAKDYGPVGGWTGPYEDARPPDDYEEGGVGIVKSVKKTETGVLVEFRTEVQKIHAMNCRDTDRISWIDANGRVRYHQDCVGAGMRTIRETPKPVVLPRDAASGVRPGAYLKASAEFSAHGAKSRPGYPIEVYKSMKMKPLVNAYGFGL